jgi:hypothetical protein
MADYSTGGSFGDVFVSEVWSKDILLALQATTSMADIVDRYDTDVKSGGDKIHVPRIASRTAITRPFANTTAITFSAVTETEFTLDITTEALDAFSVRDVLEVQSNYELRSRYTKESGKSIQRKIDTDLLSHAGAHTLVTLQIGTTATTTARISATFLSRAMMHLDVQNNVAEDRYFVVDGYGHAQILEVDNFIRWDATGKENGPIITGKVGTYYGLEVYMNNLCYSPATNIVTGIVFQKNAIALALQKDISVKTMYDIDYDSNKVLSKAIYGYGVAYTAGVIKVHYGTSGM